MLGGVLELSGVLGGRPSLASSSATRANSFAHVLERGGMRRTWLRGRENVHKRYLIHVAGYNLGVLMRALFGAGTPKSAAAIKNAFVFVIQSAASIIFIVLAEIGAKIAALIFALAPAAD